ncbi:MAG: enoyl-CoA hydratase/isomerase family protein [Halioglobus sp.]|nr:enoyl-CoA hydratase/isomerase family protein [Halioglobus sp.]
MSYTVAVTWPEECVAVATFADAQRQNQLCWAAIDELAQAVAGARAAGARVVILASGLQGHWLEHAWLQDLLYGLDGKPQTGSGAGWFQLQQELAHEDIVSIAAISGDTAGGGAEMGWACDLRIAERQARFAQPEVNMGLTTGVGGTSRLAHLVGRSAVTEMVLTGRPQSAARLYELGGLHRLVEEGASLSAALQLATELKQKAPAATAGLKRILANTDNTPLGDALRYEQEVFQSVVVTDAARAGMLATQGAYDRGDSIAQVNGYEK